MDEDSILKRWFTDYLNPTYEELKLWMLDPESFEPGQNWDIIIGDGSRLPTFVRLASIDSPQRENIVHYLHVSTANAFYNDQKQILDAVRLVPDDGFTDLLAWKKKALLLLDTPSSFREGEWFDHRM